MIDRDKAEESYSRAVGKGFFLRNLQRAWTALCKLNAVQKSLLVTAALSASLTSVFGANGAVSGVLLSLLAAPLTYLVLAKSKKNGWLKALISFIIAICSLAVSFVVGAIAMATSHQAIIAAADGINTIVYGSTVGARSRNYANKVISAVTVQSNAESMQKEIRFLLGSSQYKWLTPSQKTALTKKNETVSSILAQSSRDNALLEQLRSALSTKITSDNYKEILAAATLLPKETRFNLLVSSSDQHLLEERRQAALKQEQLEILKQQQIKVEAERKKAEDSRRRAVAEQEKARLADYNAYLEAVTEVRKNVTRSVVAEMDSRGITYDSETHPVRLQIIQQIETEMRPRIYDSAPKTLTPAQLDSIWQEIQSQIKSNL